MNKDRKEILYALQASSIDELRASLPSDKVTSKSVTRFVALALNNPQILVAPFHFDHVEKKEVKERLMLKAVELLSLPLDAIGLDYQVFESSEGKVNGIFVCFPKEVLHDYLSVLDEAGYVPIKIMPAVAADIDSFLHQYGRQSGRICLLDFSKANIVYCAVFSNGQCDFLREIPYEDVDEIEHEIVQSLRCACATSSVKKFDHIYFSGDISRKTQVAEKVKHIFCENVTQGYFIDAEVSLRCAENIFSLNLVRNRTFSLKQRRVITQATRTVLTACCAVAIILGIRIFTAELKIKNMRSSYTALDYERAVNLTRRVQHIKYEQ